jgi:hypothetical protein
MYRHLNNSATKNVSYKFKKLAGGNQGVVAGAKQLKVGRKHHLTYYSGFMVIIGSCMRDFGYVFAK